MHDVFVWFIADRAISMLSNCTQIARAYIVRPRHLRYDTTTLGVGSIVCRGNVITTHLQKSLYESILHWEMMDPLGDILDVDGKIMDSVVSWASYRRARRMIGSN